MYVVRGNIAYCSVSDVTCQVVWYKLIAVDKLRYVAEAALQQALIVASLKT